MKELHMSMAEYLSSLLSEEGIFDPIEKAYVKNSYSNAFFTLLADRIYTKTGKKKWAKRRDIALQAELDAIRNRFNTKGIFRWEFKNLALLLLYYENKIRKRRKLGNKLEAELSDYLKSMINLDSYQTNWFAMRGLNYLLRYKCFGNPKDIIKAKKQIKEVLTRQTEDGFFLDTPKSKSFQYHAYTVMLLCKFYSLGKYSVLQYPIKQGLDFLRKVTDNEGDFNYYGRGQKQLFGYVSSILAFSFGSKFLPKDGYDSQAKLTLNFIEQFAMKNYIVMNKDQKYLAGWYKYNCLTDYLSFATALLFESNKLLDFTKTKLPTPKNEYHFFPSINLFVKRTKDYFICIGGDAKTKISSQLAGLVHIYPNVVCTSGGPPFNLIESFGGSNQNYFGPNISSYNQLYESKITLLGSKLRQVFDSKDAKTEFVWDFSEGVSVKFLVRPKHTIDANLLHYSARKKIKSNVKVNKIEELLCPDGKVGLYESELQTFSSSKEVKIKLVDGNLEAQQKLSSYRNLKPKSSIKNQNIYIFLMFVHFAKSFLSKMFLHPKDFLSILKYYRARSKYGLY